MDFKWEDKDTQGYGMQVFYLHSEWSRDLVILIWSGQQGDDLSLGGCGHKFLNTHDAQTQEVAIGLVVQLKQKLQCAATQVAVGRYVD